MMALSELNVFFRTFNYLNDFRTKKEDQIVAEQTVKEFERQLGIVKMELLKLTMVKNEHAGLFLFQFQDPYYYYSINFRLILQLPRLVQRLSQDGRRSFSEERC
jgi:hypothetical protein